MIGNVPAGRGGIHQRCELHAGSSHRHPGHPRNAPSIRAGTRTAATSSTCFSGTASGDLSTSITSVHVAG